MSAGLEFWNAFQNRIFTNLKIERETLLNLLPIRFSLHIDLLPAILGNVDL